jgi:hypothetical protein
MPPRAPPRRRPAPAAGGPGFGDSARVLLALAALYAAMSLLAYRVIHMRHVAPLGADAPRGNFSEGRVLQHLRRLAVDIPGRQVPAPTLGPAVRSCGLAMLICCYCFYCCCCRRGAQGWRPPRSTSKGSSRVSPRVRARSTGESPVAPFPASFCTCSIPIGHECLLERVLCSGLWVPKIVAPLIVIVLLFSGVGLWSLHAGCSTASWNTSPSTALNLEQWNLGCDKVIGFYALLAAVQQYLVSRL